MLLVVSQVIQAIGPIKQASAGKPLLLMLEKRDSRRAVGFAAPAAIILLYEYLPIKLIDGR